MRKDGTRVRGADAMYNAHPLRHEASLRRDEHDRDRHPHRRMQAYLNQKRKEGFQMSHLGVVLAAYLRTAAEYPLLNRFVVNKAHLCAQ